MTDVDKNLPAEPEVPADDAIIGVALKWSLAVAGLLAVAVVSVLVWLRMNRKTPADVVTKLQLPDVRDVQDVPVPLIPFRDVTRERGIKFVHENGAYGEKLLPETMGGGCAFLDYDNDGDQDLLLINSTFWPWDPGQPEGRPTSVLYANDGQGNFRDVSAEAGMDLSCYGMGVACGDYDNDGDVDLYVSAVGSNHLLRNDEGAYSDVTDEAGVAGAEDEWSTSCAWLDYNNDGRLDLFVCNYVQWSRDLDLGQDFRLDGVGRAYGPPTAFRGTYSYLYRNEGQGRFTDVSAEAGVQVSNPQTGVPMGKSLGVAPIDFDSDGWIDLIVANDTVQNFVFRNLGNGKFAEEAVQCGVAFGSDGQPRGAMGADAGPIRNDRSIGIVIGNFANEMTSLYVSSGHQRLFDDTAISSGLGPQTRRQLTFGVLLLDCDLDGRLDILCANGHLEEEIQKVQQQQRYEQPPQLFWNNGTGQGSEFVLVGRDKCGEDFWAPMVGRGATYADIDSDGDLDVLLTACGAAPRLLLNQQQLGHSWLRVRLEGGLANRDAAGAWVTAHVGQQSYPRQVMPARSYLSQVELPVTFGLGPDVQQVDRLVIRWPDGQVQEMTDVEVNQLLRVRK